MPALLFATIAKEPVASMLDWPFIASFGGGSLLIFALVMAVARKRAHRPTAAATVWGLAAAMTNTGFVALPVLHGMFGEQALLPAAVATFFVAVVMLPAGVVLIEGAASGRGGWAAARHALLTSLRNPMVNSTLLGFAWALSGRPLPALLDDYLGILAGALTPCALFAIGLGLHLEDLRDSAAAAVTLALLKLIALLAVVLALALALGVSPFQTVAAVVCAAVPTAKSLYIMAGEYRVERELVAATISLSTLGSVASLLLWLLILAQLLPSAFPAP
jgi:predicted permease